MANSVELIKRAAVEAVEAAGPVKIVYGKVISASPLKIQVDQKSIYTEKMLVLTRNVTDYEMDIEVSHQTEYTSGGSSYAAFDSHNHKYKGKKKIKVYNSLVEDDWVAMAREQGGKRYVVLDRIAAHPSLEGEWL